VLQSARGSVRLKPADSCPHSLLLWNVIEQSDTDTSETSCPTYIHYLSFHLAGDEPLPCFWSHPVRLRISAAGKRHTLALPITSDEGLSSRAFCLAVQSDSTIVYLTLADDKFPFVELQNNCDIPLFYGQAATDNAGLTGTSQ